MMNSVPNEFRKAIETRKDQEGVRKRDVEREQIIRESKIQYRGFVESINNASDREIEQALRAW
jgi:hypothetical protein